MPELEKVKCSTPDFAEETAKKILALLPECAGEGGAVDIEKLKQCLSSKVIEGNVERYEFTWPGKRAAKAAASVATTKTLRPCEAESVGRDGTPGGFDSENLYIEGDNLEVLKLLQTSYANQVKMIYIDPPYNTGHDFVYRDRFSLTQKELESEAGAFDEDGNRFEVNDSSEARYHSNWCSMMYPRLKLARNLLRDDGVLFMSIDSHEFCNLLKLGDEVFGESNRVACLTVINNMKGRSDADFFAPCNEYILVYAKSQDELQLNGFRISNEEIDEDYKFEDEIGKYKPIALRKTGNSWRREDRPFMFYPILLKNGAFSLPPREEISKLYDQKKAIFDDSALSEIVVKWQSAGYKVFIPKDENGNFGRWRWGIETFIQEKDINLTENAAGAVCSKMRANIEDGSIRMKTAKTVFYRPEYDTGSGAKILDRLFGGKKCFDNPKSLVFIYDLLSLIDTDNGIFLDFFAGSATVAHAVLQLNAKDNGNRKFVMIQLPEMIDPTRVSGDAKKTAQNTVEFLDSIEKPHNVCEIGKERIRRAGKKIAEENATNTPNLDIGFRVLKLDSSSLNDTSSTVGETTQAFENFDRIRSGRSPEDLLFQMLLETHIPLSDPIETKKVGGNNVFFVSGNALVACLDPSAKMTTEFFIEIAKLKPGIAFFRDDAFADDSARTNLQQAFDQFSPTTSIKVI